MNQLPPPDSTIALNIQSYTDVLSVAVIDMKTKQLLCGGDIPWNIIDVARKNAKEAKPKFNVRPAA